MLVNGKPIYIKGVNRHEHNQFNGRTLTHDQIEKEVIQMKQFNINALRCSHYPNDIYLYEICDEYGLYVVDEANIEAHGVITYTPASDYFHKAISPVASDSLWKGSLQFRMQFLVVPFATIQPFHRKSRVIRSHINGWRVSNSCIT